MDIDTKNTIKPSSYPQEQYLCSYETMNSGIFSKII